MADRMRQDAIIRKLEVIGEAVEHLSDGTKQRRPEISWRRIAGMRDRLTHAYVGVDLALVWERAEVGRSDYNDSRHTTFAILVRKNTITFWRRWATNGSESGRPHDGSAPSAPNGSDG